MRGDRDIGAGEAALVRAALDGSPDAFGELAGRYRNGLFRYLLARCASRADAEDVLQEALVNAWRHLATYDPRWRFSTWLYRIALRLVARQRPVARAMPGDVQDDDGDPLARCIARDRRTNLWLTAKRILSADAYAAMWLHYAEDLPVAEVAAALDRSRSWTKVTLMRSRRRLKKEYDDETITD